MITHKGPLTTEEFMAWLKDGKDMSSKGIYVTDENGEIRVYGVVGTIVAKELEAAPGYVIDPKTQTQTVAVNAEDTQTLVFRNEPLVSLTITKLDSVTGKPVPGAEFTVRDSYGNLLGKYVTGQDGTVTVTGLIPGTTLIVHESSVPNGYVLDPTPKVITVKSGSNSVSSGNNDLVFENDPTVSLVIEKYIDGTTTPLQGVTFLVTDSSGKVIGGSNGEYITDENGRIVIRDLEPGATVVAREVKTVDGYVLDTTPKTIEIKAGEAQTLRFYNKAEGTLVVQKKDRQTGEPLAGVEFEITYSDGSFVDADYGHLSSKGLYKTDANGEIRIPGVVGTVVVTETKPLEGYVMDEGTRSQTVVVNPGDTQTIVVYNTKMSGLTVIKKDEDTGARLKGVQFEVRKANGEIIGHYTTDTNGTVYLSNLASGWYEVIETSAASGYVLDDTPHRIEVKDGGAALLEITNRRISGITIHKTDSATGEGKRPNRSCASGRKNQKGNRAMENILTVLFEVESEGYQAFMELKRKLVTDEYTVLQGALVKKSGNTVSTIEALTSGVDSTDDTLKGGLIGALVGVLGGPLGVLLGGMTGELIGSAVDASDVGRNGTMLETVGAKLKDGEVALLLLVQEDSEYALDSRFNKFKVTILRNDAASVQDEVEQAEKMEREMAEEARRKLHEERSAERKQKIESNRAKLKASFESFKDKFKKT